MSSVNKAFAQRAKKDKISNRSYLYEKETVGVLPEDIIVLTTKTPDSDMKIAATFKIQEPVIEVVSSETLSVRARDEKGHYVKDDLSTPDINEAWVKNSKAKKNVTKKV